MKYKYYHDANLKAVYRVPLDPQVHETMDKRKRQIIGWTVSMKIEISRADNVLSNGRWIYPTADYPSQSFENIGNRYNRERVVDYFHMHHDPKCEEISEDAYVALKKTYDEHMTNRQ